MIGPDGFFYAMRSTDVKTTGTELSLARLPNSRPEVANPFTDGLFLRDVPAHGRDDITGARRQSNVEEIHRGRDQRAMQLAVDKGDYAYFNKRYFTAGEKLDPSLPMPTGTWALDDSARANFHYRGVYYRRPKYEPAKKRATRMSTIFGIIRILRANGDG